MYVMSGASLCFPIGLVAFLIITSRFDGPGIEPLITTNPFLTRPYLTNPPFGFTSSAWDASPILRIFLLYSVLLWYPICPAIATVHMVLAGVHGPIEPT